MLIKEEVLLIDLNSVFTVLKIEREGVNDLFNCMRGWKDEDETSSVFAYVQSVAAFFRDGLFLYA